MLLFLSNITVARLDCHHLPNTC